MYITGYVPCHKFKTNIHPVLEMIHTALEDVISVADPLGDLVECSLRAGLRNGLCTPLILSGKDPDLEVSFCRALFEPLLVWWFVKEWCCPCESSC